MASDSFNVVSVSHLPMAATPHGPSQETAPSANSIQQAAPAERTPPGLADVNALNKDRPATVEQVAQAVDRINQMMQNGQQTLSFQLDDDSGQMVVRVTDAQTKEVIRQIPSEETLKFAEYVDGLVGLIFNKKA
ncbi:flagellar protein FlaG [uncultured Thiocystis sp.]|jgi:flagellar protein FlaG|uniref:flagellar protein FlaG n=1 Tax=uncultured Thiocystis sp. TaxID=1202134 RepID=UPI0025E207A2|nr:flagellar protein FlaG [uncultured Thiocystis sp.]